MPIDKQFSRAYNLKCKQRGQTKKDPLPRNQEEIKMKTTKIIYTKKESNPFHHEKQAVARYEVTFLESKDQLARPTEIHYRAIIKLYNNGAVECESVGRIVCSKWKLGGNQSLNYDDLPNRYKRTLQEFFKHGNMIFSACKYRVKSYSDATINSVYKSLSTEYLNVDINIYI